MRHPAHTPFMRSDPAQFVDWALVICIGSREGEHSKVAPGSKSGRNRRPRINPRLATQNTLHGVLVQAGVSLELDLHWRATGGGWRASSILQQRRDRLLGKP